MSERVLRIGRICEKRGTQAMIAKATGISRPAVSRIVRGLEPPYPKRGRAIAAAVGWAGDWRELFEEVDEEGGPM
ncbi:helix-turn-helix domain-containing protein [Xiamenia xianingshaonis]|uniref:helix-turn-helix domain-containing protein n=1 Tax=Xiamenia xianingshaonis TaxID=2682776 RepID=UPI0028F73808|nr:helix-turn-helix transcriptional regulator [Xiamenia xianingshaonis]